jgi:N-succinyldiaminopimelate aminotransferase
MNPNLSLLQAYPFERLRQLFAPVQPNPAYSPISLGIGEPRHATPELIKQAYCKAINDPKGGLAAYPATAGVAQLRESIGHWLQRRYGLALNTETQILPINGSREALFAFAQTVVNPAARVAPDLPALVVCPNPFYQIYEGAAFLSGAQPYFVPSDPARNFAQDWDSVPERVGAHPAAVCLLTRQPHRRGHAAVRMEESCLTERPLWFCDRLGRVLQRDLLSATSRRWAGWKPPPSWAGRISKICCLLTSLSKRSNVPGMRSGFWLATRPLVKQFLLYRTYHGSAMSPVVQSASIAAWNDEQHVRDNREQCTARSSPSVTPMLADVLDVALPDAGFYLWAKVPGQRHRFRPRPATLFTM